MKRKTNKFRVMKGGAWIILATEEKRKKGIKKVSAPSGKGGGYCRLGRERRNREKKFRANKKGGGKRRVFGER